MVDTALVLRQMEGAGTKLNIVILDACRNNPFGGRGLRASDGGLAQMRAPEGTLISYATQPGSVARDGSDGNSPYTKALVEAIRKPGQDIFQTFNTVGPCGEAGDGRIAAALGVVFADRRQFLLWGGNRPAFRLPAPPPAAAAAAPGSKLPRAWSVTQNTTSIAVMEDLHSPVRQNRAYGSMARARLGEITIRSQLVPRPRRGAYHDRHGRWARDAEDAAVSARRYDAAPDGISRVVFTPRRVTRLAEISG